MPRADLEEWADGLFLGEYALLKRKTFGCPAYYKGKKMFAFLYEDALGIKLDPDEVKTFVSKDSEVYAHFNPGDGIMKNWLMITYPEASDYDQELELIASAFKQFA